MEKEKAIHLAIADDHPLIRKGLIDYFVSFEQFSVIIEASDGLDLIEKLEQTTVLPDICVLDISMPNLNGYQTLKKIKGNWTAIKILIFSAYYDEFSVTEMFSNGANGFLKKNCSPSQLQHALASIYYNDYYLTQTASKNLSSRQRRNLALRITDREMEFLCHCCSELNYNEIAKLMHVSSRTVEAFRDALFTKLDIKTRAGLVMFAFQNGIVSSSKQRE